MGINIFIVAGNIIFQGLGSNDCVSIGMTAVTGHKRAAEIPPGELVAVVEIFLGIVEAVGITPIVLFRFFYAEYILGSRCIERLIVCRRQFKQIHRQSVIRVLHIACGRHILRLIGHIKKIDVFAFRRNAGNRISCHFFAVIIHVHHK